MSKPHLYEHVILAYYRGEEIQFSSKNTPWVDVAPYAGSAASRRPSFDPVLHWRVKPKVVTMTVSLDDSDVQRYFALLEIGRRKSTASEDGAFLERLESALENAK